MTASSKTPVVRDQNDFAQSPLHVGLGMGEVSQQSGFQPVLRRKLMAALSMTGRELGLRPATVMVLDTLLSFLPCTDATGKEMPVTPLHLLTVYASNDTISFRARGLTDRQLRRHFDLLERLGFIQRRDSANGKRFPIYQNGKVVGAFGIDLMPLFARADAILARADALREEQQEIRGLKARIGKLRAQLLSAPPALPEDALQFIDQLRNLTRRAGLTLVEAKALLSRLMGFAGQNVMKSTQIAVDIHPDVISDTMELPAPSPEASACAGQNVRHNKPKNTYTKKSISSATRAKPTGITDLWSNFTGLAEFFPVLPGSMSELMSVLQQTAAMLRIDMDQYHRAVSALPPLHLAQIFDRILRRHQTIQDPNAYFRNVIRSELCFGREQVPMGTL